MVPDGFWDVKGESHMLLTFGTPLLTEVKISLLSSSCRDGAL